MDLATLRRALPLTQQTCYLQTGSLGPNPLPEQETIRQANDEFQLYGPAAPEALEKWHQRAERARAQLADLLGTRPEALAWTTNSSQSVRAVFATRRWSKGDEVITSSLEHVSSRSLWDGLEQRFGVQVHVVPVVDDDAEFLNRLEACFTARTRMLFLSHVSCIDGRRLPVAPASTLAHDRDVTVTIDGAQAPGQFPVNLTELNADFYVGSAHKWLLGPMGLGFLVVGEGGMEHFNPSIIPHTTSGGEACGLAAQETAASRGEVGTTDLAARAGFAVALEMFGDIGVGTIERHVRGLTARLRAGLTDLPNVQMIGNLPPERSSGISSFVVEGWQAQQHRELVDRLYRQERILVKFQPEFAGIRVSLASFNSIEEIERLLEALQPFVSSPVL